MVKINGNQIYRVAELIKKLPRNGHGNNFYSFKRNGAEVIASDMYPALNHPQAIEFFFWVCSQQFGFWYGDDCGYVGPIFGVINGKKMKGSDLLWGAAKKALDKDETRFAPSRFADITPQELAYEYLSDDNGFIPFPDFEARFRLTRSFGKWFARKEISPSSIISSINKCGDPVCNLIGLSSIIPGYRDDLWKKKNLLLAMALANRPEHFLHVSAAEPWDPIVDYHLMRVSLRLGLVDITDYSVEDTNKRRKWVSVSVENKIRGAVFQAVQALIRKSSRPMSFIDEKMWMARNYCPEMERPDCSKCIFDSVCEKRVELFQPIFRTTAY